jgi:hypothetical protein
MINVVSAVIPCVFMVDFLKVHYILAKVTKDWALGSYSIVQNIKVG